MIRYFLRRLLWMIPIILGVAIIVFTLMTFCPGDPAQILLSGAATEEDRMELRDNLGLNDPFLVRLGTFLGNTFLKFDLGTSWMSKVSIASEIGTRLPRTFVLSLMTLMISISVGVPLGVIAAVKQGGIGDNIATALALVGASIPGFWLALLLILVFSVRLNWLPSMGIGGIEYFILPALTGCTNGVATLTRQTRSSMLDVIRADYITTARSKGVTEFNVIVRHALKNALIPIITVVGTQFGMMLGGTMILETIFAIPGMGSYIIGGVNQRDYPVVQAGSIFLAAVFSFSMLMVDILYAAVDPRIKAQYSKKRGKVKAK